MDIEDLSKSQLLLLTILVNFVVSIATGVMTVSLLDQAPTAVTQTVNRIVDHTIETVTTQVPVIGNIPAEVPTTEELLTSAIAADAARTVKLYRPGVEAPAATGVFFPDARAVMSISETLPTSIRVEFPDGTIVSADRTAREGNIVRFALAQDATLPGAPSANLIASTDLKQGQTVIGLTAEGSVATGIISRVDDAGIHTDIPGIPLGAAAVSLSGGVIGIHAGSGVFVTTERLIGLSGGIP